MSLPQSSHEHIPKKDEVFELVQKSIGSIITFKQAQYDHKKQKVRETIEKEAQEAQNQPSENPTAAE